MEGDFKELPVIGTEEHRAIRKGWRRWRVGADPPPTGPGSGLRAALEGPNGLSRPTFGLGGGTGAHGGPPPVGPPQAADRQVSLFSRPVSRPDLPESRLGGQRPEAPLFGPSSPAQSLQLVHGDRQAGDRRQAPGGWRAEQRLHDGLRCGRGAAGEEQAAAVRGLRAQFHGGALPPRDSAPSSSASAAPAPPRRHWPRPRAPLPAPAGQTQTRPRGSGTRLPRASEEDGRVSGLGRRQPQARALPLTPRGRRAGAGNLKIKSKQAGQV